MAEVASREEAELALKSTDMHRRLEGSRFFEKCARREDAEMLLSTLASEDVSWVRSSLQKGIERASGTTAKETPQRVHAEPAAARADQRSLAMARITGMFLHEIEPIVGTIKYLASRDLVDFETSELSTELKRLDACLEAIRELSTASRSGAHSGFNLAETVRRAIERVRAEMPFESRTAGMDPCMVSAYPPLLDLVIQNGLRNAVESYPDDAQSKLVEVTWAATERDYYVTIVDSGRGLPPGVVGLADIRSTNKPGHLGMGLTIISEAAQSLRATVTLAAREPAGACLEFRWPTQETLRREITSDRE